MTNETLEKDTVKKKKDEKFFFNVHIFDEPDEPDEPEDLPPIFTEDELIAAKKQAFEEGKKQGRDEATQEATQSRETLVSQVLQKISQDTSILFEQEEERAALYEREVIALSLKIFEKIFPIYSEEHRFEQLCHSIEKVLKKQQGPKDIAIYVSAANKDGVEQLLTDLRAKGLNGQFQVHSDDNMSESACRIDWADGGAHFDRDAMASEIEALLKQMLAGTGANRHDEEQDGPAPQEMVEEQTETQAEIDEELKSAETPDTIEEASGDDT